ncbi:MAG TPA: hypothetical protein VNX88_18195 [Terriglobales bacterium]|nr:hypothetical protein [Terriglobales bacterium]
MDTRISSILRVVFLIAVLPITVLPAWPQAPAEKNKVQANAPDKSSGETREVETHFSSATTAPSFRAVELQSVSTTITLAREDDSKKIYEDIAAVGGVTVLFDPDYVSRQIRVDLHRVPFRDALEAVALESKTFWRPVTPNSILIAADTMTKRRDLEQSVIKVFPIPNPTPILLQDLANTLRLALDITRVQPMAEAGTIIVRGTPDQISLATKLIDDIRKARPKLNRYRVEVRVSEMDGKTKLNSKSYRLFVQSNQPQSLYMLVPPPAESQTTSDKSKDARESGSYQKIDCVIASESEQTVALSIKGTFSESFGDQAGRANDGRQFSIDAKPVLTLDKPMILNSFDDPASKHTIQTEVAVTRLAETP